MKRLWWVIVLASAATGCVTSGRHKRAEDPKRVAEIYTEKGLQYLQQGYYDAALQDLEKAVRLDPDNAQAHNALAVMNQHIQRGAAARAEFDIALRLAPEDSTILNNYGQFLCQQGDYVQAQALFRKAYTDPLAAYPWVTLTNAAHCAKLNHKESQANELLRRALERSANYAPALSAMATAAYATQDFSAVRELLQRYRATADDTPETLLLSIQTAHALGHEMDVGHFLSQLLQQFPDSRAATAARQRYALSSQPR